MTNASQQPTRIRHDADAGSMTEGRFSLVVDGVTAELVYRRDDAGRITMLHTGVPQAIGNRGFAGQLVQAALDWARENGLKVHAACAYSDAWIRKHPDYEALRV